MLLPVILLAVGAVSCLALRERRPTTEPRPPAAGTTETVAPGALQARTPDQAGLA